jgi:GntR family transcriptional regulator, arabinose operon transcriptional repressor
VLSPKGYFLTINRTEPEAEKERALLKSLFNENVKGIIYYPSQYNFTFDLLHNFSLYNFPIVTIDKYFDGLPISCVIPKNFDGAFKATSHLIKLGHKRIAYLSDSKLETKTSVKQRYYGYCKPLIDNGV